MTTSTPVLPSGWTVTRESVVVQSGPRNFYRSPRWVVRDASGSVFSSIDTSKTRAVGHAARFVEQRSENQALLDEVGPLDVPTGSYPFVIVNVDDRTFPTTVPVTTETQGLALARQLQAIHGHRFAVTAR